MWNRFDIDREKLNLYDNPNFEEGSGITNRQELVSGVREYIERYKNESNTIIKARAIEYVCDNAAIEVNPIDWFGINFFGWFTWPKADKVYKELGVGEPYSALKPLRFLVENWICKVPRPAEYKEAEHLYRECGLGNIAYDYDHSVPDWDSVVGLGFKGILERARKNRALYESNGTLTKEKEDFYNGIEIAYSAVIRMYERVVVCAEKHINDDEKMPVMIKALKTVINGAPETFYEFLLLIYLYQMVQEHIDCVQVRSLGNIDVDGYKYYKNDIEKGTLTKEKAIELLRYFYEKFTNQAHKFGQPLYFGGDDDNGESLINELSYTMIEAYDRSCIVNPKLFIKVSTKTPDKFLKTVLDMMRRGNNSVVFVNEDLGAEIMRKLGKDEADTKRLIATGCNNFISRGNECTVEHIYVNLVKAVEFAFNNGVDPILKEKIGCNTGDVSDFKTFEDFKSAYLKQAEFCLNKAFVMADFIDENLFYFNPTPIYSGAISDCAKSGKDVANGGIKYANTTMFLSCHATVADSLYMVKKYVYDLKKYTIEEVKNALLANFEGYEEMYETFKNDPEKYGNDYNSVDSIFTEVTEHMGNLVNGRKNKRGGMFVANGESIINAHNWANLCGATPDGRKRGDLLSKNMSASTYMDKKGITAHIKSVTKIDATTYPYGCPFDYLLHPSATQGEEGLNAWLGLLRTFNKRGGFGFQGSVQDSKTLKDAQAHPEKYPNLQVRISGWSWYFTKMEKKYQDEFIRRAEVMESVM